MVQSSGESQFRYSGTHNGYAVHGFVEAAGVFKAVQTIARRHNTTPNGFNNMEVTKVRDSGGIACNLLVAKWPVPNKEGEAKWKIAVTGDVDIREQKEGIILPFSRVSMPTEKRDISQRTMGPAPAPPTTSPATTEWNKALSKLETDFIVEPSSSIDIILEAAP